MFAPTYHSFGLDISDLSLKLAEARYSLHTLKLSAWNSLDVPVGIIENGHVKNMPAAIQAVHELMQSAHGRISTRYVVGSLPETKSFIKLIRIPSALITQASSREALNAVVLEQLTHHIPIPLDEARVDWQFVSQPQTQDDFEVLVGAVPKTVVSEYAQLLKSSGLIPIALEIEAQSIVRALCPATVAALAQNPPFPFKPSGEKTLRLPRFSFRLRGRTTPDLPHTRQTIIIIDSGATRTSLILWADGIIKFTTSHPLSGAALTKEISDKLKLTIDESERTKKICGVDPKKCKGAVARILDKAISELADGVVEMSSFYLSHFPHVKPVQRLDLCGGNAQLANIDTQLSAKTGIPCTIANPMLHLGESIKGIPSDQRLSFTTAIGLALRGLV